MKVATDVNREYHFGKREVMNNSWIRIRRLKSEAENVSEVALLMMGSSKSERRGTATKNRVLVKWSKWELNDSKAASEIQVLGVVKVLIKTGSPFKVDEMSNKGANE